MNEQTVIEILKEIHHAIELFSIRCWLDQGMLLGAYRDGKMLQGDGQNLQCDADIDFSIVNTEELFIALIYLKQHGYEILIEPSNVFLWKNGVPITFAVYFPYQTSDVFDNVKLNIFKDLCFNRGYPSTSKWQQRFERLYSYSKFPKQTNLNGKTAKWAKRIIWFPPARWIINRTYLWFRKNILGGETFTQATPVKFYKEFSTLEFYGMKFDIPLKIEEYLQFKYGKNWRTPPLSWDYCKQDGGAILGHIYQYLKVETL